MVSGIEHVNLSVMVLGKHQDFHCQQFQEYLVHSIKNFPMDTTIQKKYSYDLQDCILDSNARRKYLKLALSYVYRTFRIILN